MNIVVNDIERYIWYIGFNKELMYKHDLMECIGLVNRIKKVGIMMILCDSRLTPVLKSHRTKRVSLLPARLHTLCLFY